MNIMSIGKILCFTTCFLFWDLLGALCVIGPMYLALEVFWPWIFIWPITVSIWFVVGILFMKSKVMGWFVEIMDEVFWKVT